MYIYTFLILALCFTLYKNNYPNNYEKLYNKMVVKYSEIRLKIENKVILVSYNCIYLYSLCQINYNKICNLFLTEPSEYNAKHKTTLIFLDKNQNYTYGINVNLDILNKLELIQNMYNTYNGEVETILLLDKPHESKQSYYKFYTSIPETFDYKVSEVNFMSVELEHNDKFYKICLKDEECNYYIVGNVLNQYFFKYYLKNILKVPINETNFDYKLIIIDHNVNFITLASNQYIVFGELDYHIYPYSNDPSNDDTNDLDDFINLDTDNLLYA